VAEKTKILLYLSGDDDGEREETGPRGRGRRGGLAERKALWVVNVLEA